MRFCVRSLRFCVGSVRFCVGSMRFCVRSMRFCVGSLRFCVGSMRFCLVSEVLCWVTEVGSTLASVFLSYCWIRIKGRNMSEEIEIGRLDKRPVIYDIHCVHTQRFIGLSLTWWSVPFSHFRSPFLEGKGWAHTAHIYGFA